MTADRGGWWPGAGGREEDADREQGPADGGPGAPNRAPRGLGSPGRSKPPSRYSIFVGIAFAVVALIAILNAGTSDEGGIAGADAGAEHGVPMPQFAVPDVLEGPDADANVSQDDCEGDRNPCPEDQQQAPACEIPVDGAIRVCDLFDRPLAISFWFTRGGDCEPSQDSFAEVADARGDEVNFLSVNVLDDRDEVAAIVRERGWELPVGHDADGAVSNLLSIGVCPTVVLAYPGGIIHSVEIKPGNFEPPEIDAAVDELVRASRERARGGA